MKSFKFLEYVWLAVAVAAIAAGVFRLLMTRSNDDWLIFVVAAIAISMYYFRKQRRKKLEFLQKQEDEAEN